MDALGKYNSGDDMTIGNEQVTALEGASDGSRIDGKNAICPDHRTPSVHHPRSLNSTLQGADGTSKVRRAVEQTKLAMSLPVIQFIEHASPRK